MLYLIIECLPLDKIKITLQKFNKVSKKESKLATVLYAPCMLREIAG